ncbi:conserved phage C-terminal domain-containing protein [Sporosarcina sp. CAU 1771]
MKLLINEAPLQIIPSLALKVGLNEAIVLQQLHFLSLISQNWREGHKWVYKTYEEWRNDAFPFWSVDTIKRTIRKLEKNGFVRSTSSYNRMKIDKTKWYRIDYSALHDLTLQNAHSRDSLLPDQEMQIAPSTQVTLPLPITKEFKSIKKELVEKDLDVESVVAYLNLKTSKQFKPTSKTTERSIRARFHEGYVLEDFLKVIDLKVKDWLNDSHMHKYLRPSTLFSPTNFENYLEETRKNKTVATAPLEPVELDFSKGEE